MHWRDYIPEGDHALMSALAAPSRRPIEQPFAVIAIDMVQAFFGTSPKPVPEAIGEYATSCGERAWESLEGAAEVLDGARRVQAPVIWTRPDSQYAGRAGRSTQLNRHDGPVGYGEFLPQAAPTADEYILDKPRASAFWHTALEPLLRSLNLQTIVLIGGTTSGCVRATAVDAYSYGFDVHVIEDACFDRFAISHAVTLFDLTAKYASVCTAHEFVSDISSTIGARQ